MEMFVPSTLCFCLPAQPALAAANKQVGKKMTACYLQETPKWLGISHRFKRDAVFGFSLCTNPPRLLLRVGTFFGERRRSLVPCRYCSYGQYQSGVESSAPGGLKHPSKAPDGNLEREPGNGCCKKRLLSMSRAGIVSKQTQLKMLLSNNILSKKKKKKSRKKNNLPI